MGKIDNTLKDVYLAVGEYHFSDEPSRIKTVLGSCVTITLYDKATKTGAMSHGLLPKCQNYGKCEKRYVDCFRYIECSFWAMLKKMEEKGIPKHRLEVKLFGGASIINSETNNSNYFKVGQKNVQAAIEVIKEAGLDIKSYDFGGANSRKLSFRTDTGAVTLVRAGLSSGAEF